MNTIEWLTRIAFALSLSVGTVKAEAPPSAADCPEELNVELRQLHSSKVHNVCDFYRANAAVLIVNTASHCGYTKQFKGLETLYQKHKDKGLVVLGFPSNSFNQEEKSEEGTARVCYKNYGVTFPMFEHIEVKGQQAHTIFRYLAEHSQAPEWNFNKYLLSDGKVQHFGSKTTPDDPAFEEKIILSF